jgi:hypothetical protein
LFSGYGRARTHVAHCAPDGSAAPAAAVAKWPGAAPPDGAALDVGGCVGEPDALGLGSTATLGERADPLEAACPAAATEAGCAAPDPRPTRVTTATVASRARIAAPPPNGQASRLTRPTGPAWRDTPTR